jgi:hypothetical protein
MPAAAPVRARVAADGTFERYGLRWDRKGWTDIAIELRCYRDNRQPDKGGLGAEGHFRNAWRIMWPNYDRNDWVDLMISAWCNYKYIIVIGCQRASKTYTFGHIVYLDYCAGPMDTMTSIATVTFEGLRLRMWSDVLRAIETSEPAKAGINVYQIRSTTNECRIFPLQSAHDAAEKFQIHGMSVSRTADAPGRIRGGHANRRRIVLDETQDMPAAIFDAMVNPMSAPDAKCVLLSNPVEKVSKFGEWCEPADGWASVDENDQYWLTRVGNGQGICLHFDGLKSPNVKAGKTVFPYMFSQETWNEIVANHGPDSVQAWALGRGWFPPDGMVSKIWPNSTIERARATIKFDFAPAMCASLDPAFEYDDCVLHFGQLGMPVFGQRDYKINATETIVAKLDVGATAEPKDYQVAHWVMAECVRRGVEAKHFIMDVTGNARGVFAILTKEWSRDVQGIEYGGEATDRPLRGDDNRKCNEMYQRFITELYFRASEYAKVGLLGGLDNLNRKTIDDLSARRYELKQGTKGTLMVAETKKEVKKRLGRSPDYGDPFVQFGELLIRLGTAPGGGMAQRLAQAQKVGSAWDVAKRRALKAAATYNEDKEFAYH